MIKDDYLRKFRLWIFLKSVGLGIPDVQYPRVAPVSGCHCQFVFRPRLRVAGIWMMLRDYRPPIHPRWSEGLLFRQWDEWRPSNSLRLRGQASCLRHLLGRLPLRIWGNSSVPLSPNRVQAGHSQEVPEDGSLLNSPLSPGFLMRPLGAAGQHPEAGVLLPSAFDGFDESVLGDPIAYAQCEQIPGSDTL